MQTHYNTFDLIKLTAGLLWWLMHSIVMKVRSKSTSNGNINCLSIKGEAFIDSIEGLAVNVFMILIRRDMHLDRIREWKPAIWNLQFKPLK